MTNLGGGYFMCYSLLDLLRGQLTFLVHLVAQRLGAGLT